MSLLHGGLFWAEENPGMGQSSHPGPWHDVLGIARP